MEYSGVHSEHLMVGMKKSYRQSRSELRGQASLVLLNTAMKQLATAGPCRSVCEHPNVSVPVASSE